VKALVASDERAVIFVPHNSTQRYRWTEECRVYCRNHGYEVVGVADTWEKARDTVTAVGAEVIVVARRRHLPPDRSPRVEVVGGERGRE
jgi:hypothetical protein